MQEAIIPGVGLPGPMTRQKSISRQASLLANPMDISPKIGPNHSTAFGRQAGGAFNSFQGYDQSQQ